MMQSVYVLHNATITRARYVQTVRRRLYTAYVLYSYSVSVTRSGSKTSLRVMNFEADKLERAFTPKESRLLAASEAALNRLGG